ncbi:MAG TPA: DUF4105 domain-containing protein [Candidatus Acidoferrum sp.]|nr:DUF4105 domain-containing protein [Candidatus Acidoferrum sp.]
MIQNPGKRVLRWLLRAAGWILYWLMVAILTLWSVGAIYYSNLPAPWLRTAGAVAFVIGTMAVFIWVRPRWLARVIFLAAFAGVVIWFLLIPPSNDRDWTPDLAVLPYADINGNLVTMHNIRNCDYRTETDYVVRHYDKTFDLDKLRSVDLYMVYWGSPYMAHTMMSFGFEGGDYLCFSIETRKEKGEGYSAIKGLYRQFELTYVAADERDLVRLRTNYRKGEDAYLYRLRGSPQQARQLFLDYVHRLNSLHARPEWYNAVTDNCTTGIRTQRAAADRAPWDWRMLVNGFGNELLYERGRIDTSLPMAELKKRSLINDKAKAADQDPDFSTRIREGLPGMSGNQ